MYEVSPAARRAFAPSLIVAAAYVRFIRSTERMTISCTELRARPGVGFSSTSGMAEPPPPRARKPIPSEAEAVVRDALRPQDELRGERHPPQQIPSRGCGLPTLRDQPSTSHGLTRGRSAVASTKFSSSPESPRDPTLLSSCLGVTPHPKVLWECV